MAFTPVKTQTPQSGQQPQSGSGFKPYQPAGGSAAPSMFPAANTGSSFSTPEVAGSNVSGKGIFSTIGSALISNEKKFGDTLGDATIAGEGKAGSVLRGIFDPSGEARGDYEAARRSADDLQIMNQKLAVEIAKRNIRGEDTSRLMEVYHENSGQHFDMATIAPSVNKTTKEIFGEGLGVFLDVAAAGSYSKAAMGSKSLSLASKADKTADAAKAVEMGKEFAKAYVKMPIKGKAWVQMTKLASGFVKAAPQAAIFGGAYGLSSAMQKDADLLETVQSVSKGTFFGGLTGGIIGGLSERAGMMKFVKAQQLKDSAVQSYLRGFNLSTQKTAEDLKHIAPHLIEEGWWGSKAQLYQKAVNGQELSAKQYEELGELLGVVDSGDLQQIDEMIYKEMKRTVSAPRAADKMLAGAGETNADAIMGAVEGDALKVRTGAKTGYDALVDLRSDVHHLLSVGHGMDGEGPGVQYEDLRQLARGYGATIYESRKALSMVQDNAALSQMLKMDSTIRGIVNDANPKYAEISKMYHMSGEMLDILSESAQIKQNFADKLLEWKGTMAALLGMVGLGAASASNRPAAIAGTMAISGLSLLMHSTWFSTGSAVLKNKIANHLSKMPPEHIATWVHLLNAYGPKAAELLANSGDGQEDVPPPAEDILK